MKKLLTIFLCLTLICSLSVSSFAAGTPEPIYSNDSLTFYYDQNLGLVVYDVSELNLGFSLDRTLYFLFDGFFYAYTPFVYDGFICYGGDPGLATEKFMIVLSSEVLGDYLVCLCEECFEGSHTHTLFIYDEYPFASSAPASDAPAFIAATGDGFKVMNLITTGIMSNPVLLFLLAASLIPVGIYLFKALKNAASRK